MFAKINKMEEIILRSDPPQKNLIAAIVLSVVNISTSALYMLAT